MASALYRMHVYQEAYGFTELRLVVDVFEGWLGLLVLAVLGAGVSLKAAWLPRFALLSGAGLIVALAAINPDAWIAQRNVDRYEETGKLDWSYLQGLSDDAVPVLSTLADRRYAAACSTAVAVGRRLARVEPGPLARSDDLPEDRSSRVKNRVPVTALHPESS